MPVALIIQLKVFKQTAISLIIVLCLKIYIKYNVYITLTEYVKLLHVLKTYIQINVLLHICIDYVMYMVKV